MKIAISGSIGSGKSEAMKALEEGYKVRKVIWDPDIYIYLSENTLNLSEIKNDMYMQCWYFTNDTNEIELLKIELMKEKPAGI